MDASFAAALGRFWAGWRWWAPSRSAPRSRSPASPTGRRRALGPHREVRERRTLVHRTGNGYYGGLQFSKATWKAYGGSGMPHKASRAQQIKVAERVLKAQGWRALAGLLPEARPALTCAPARRRAGRKT